MEEAEGGNRQSREIQKDARERRARAAAEIKAESNSPDVAAAAAACRHFAAPAPRITAFTLRLKNSPRVIIYLAGARHPVIVLPENGSAAPPAFPSVSHFLPVYFTRRLPLFPVYLRLRAKELPLQIKTRKIETPSRRKRRRWSFCCLRRTLKLLNAI